MEITYKIFVILLQYWIISLPQVKEVSSLIDIFEVSRHTLEVSFVNVLDESLIPAYVPDIFEKDTMFEALQNEIIWDRSLSIFFNLQYAQFAQTMY